MPLNVMLQLCRVTRASKLFQRNFYLPLLKPLSPKDALRRYIITGKNLLGSRIEHYMPVLEEYQTRMQRRKYRIKGFPKKRQRRKANMKYVTPFFDNEMEYHIELQELLSTKSKGRGQVYSYYVPDKDCTLVIPHEMERAIRDKNILDIIMAQRSEKIVVKLGDGEDTKVTLPLVAYNGTAPMYRGEGWTRKEIEEYHHHGKETMSIARLFEAKESGVEEWELEMMRLANRRRKKLKGEGTLDWKKMMAAAAENMDWDKFEEDAKQIVEEANEPVEDEPIPMELDDMAKTKNVNEKLKNAGPEVLAKLPTMAEIPELVKLLPEGVATELANVSGVKVELPSSGIERFVAGQMVKGDEGEIFMPGQTLENESGQFEYTPGFTVFLDGEPQLLPGLVMGDDPGKAMFLPGDSSITEKGELQFIETEDDIVKHDTPTPESSEEEEEDEEEEEEEEEEEKVEEVQEEEEVVEEEEEEEEEEEPQEIKPPPKRETKKFTYERPKRQFKEEVAAIKRRERPSRRHQGAPTPAPEEPPKPRQPPAPREPRKPRIIDMTPVIKEKDTIEQEKERVKKMAEKKSQEELSINRKRREIIMLAKKLIANIPPPPKYVPLEPVRKSEKLVEWERSIKNGDFFGVDYKRYLNKERRVKSYFEPFVYKNTFDTVGINRYKLWRSVY